MEETTWEQRLHALTHVLTQPTTTPTLQAQIFISSQVPCYLNWDYPPIFCHHKPTFPPLHLTWGISLFLKRVSRFGLPQTSWRSKCPYQQPPPLVLAKGLEEAQWGDQEKRDYVGRRFRRKPLGTDVNPWVPIMIPNFILLSFLFLDPFSLDEI